MPNIGLSNGATTNAAHLTLKIVNTKDVTAYNNIDNITIP